MRASTKRKIRKFISPIRRIGLKNKNFTIISNNCWGGYIYDIFGLKYLSPTIGLYFMSNEYIKFISNLKYYLSFDAEVLELKDSKYKEYFISKSMNNVMLGKVNDVEFVFVHYKSAEDGVIKWNKRRHRINFDNILIKYNDQNMFTFQDLENFKKVEFRKIFFTANKAFISNPDTYYFNCYKKVGYVFDDIKKSLKYVNVKKILNNL